MDKLKRHFVIKEILSAKIISSQIELQNELKKKGIEVNQATLSRDIQELGIARVSSTSGSSYVMRQDENSSQSHIKKLMSYEIESINTNGVLIIIKTLSGRAQGVAQVIDSLGLSSVMGTLAGDDTIFIAPKNVSSIKNIILKIKKYIA